MPSNNIVRTVTVEFNAKGEPTAVRSVDNVTDSIDELTKAQDKNRNSRKKSSSEFDNFYKKFKGVAGIAGSTTKAFSKMSQGMTSSLVPAYATLAANIFAVSAAFRVMRDAADFQRMQQAADEFGRTLGTNLSNVAKSIREITDESITMQQAMKTASIASAAGFDPGTINKLAEAARNASVALGRDMTDSLERVFSGALKAEPELLDELGIILRLKPATEKYAEVLGKAASELTTFEKQQAVVNEVIRQADEKFGHLGKVMSEGNAFAMLYAKVADSLKVALGGVTNVISPILAGLVSMDKALLGSALFLMPGVFKLFGEQASRVFLSMATDSLKAVKGIEKLNDSMKDWGDITTEVKGEIEELIEAQRHSRDERDFDTADALQVQIDKRLAAKSAQDLQGKSLLKLQTIIKSTRLDAAKLTASVNLLGLGFINAITSTDTFSTQVAILRTELTKMWAIGNAGQASLLAKSFSLLAPAIVGAGKAIGTFLKFLPWLGTILVTLDLLKLGWDSVFDSTGASKKFTASIEDLSNAVDTASDAIDRLGYGAETNFEAGINAINSLFEGSERLRRSAEGFSSADYFKNLFDESTLDKTGDVFQRQAEGLKNFLDHMGAAAPRELVQELDNLSNSAKELGGDWGATSVTVIKLSNALEATKERVLSLARAQKELNRNTFDPFNEALTTFINTGKDVVEVMENIAQAQKDIAAGNIAASSALLNMAKAFPNNQFAQQILNMEAFKTAQNEVIGNVREFISTLEKRRDALKRENTVEFYREFDSITQSLGAAQQSLEQFTDKFKQELKDMENASGDSAKIIASHFKEIAQAPEKFAKFGKARSLINVIDKSSMSLYNDLIELQEGQLEVQRKAATESAQAGVRTLKDTEAIKRLEEDRLDLLLDQIGKSASLAAKNKEYIKDHKELAKKRLPEITEILVEQREIDEDKAKAIAKQLVSYKEAKDSLKGMGDAARELLDVLGKINQQNRELVQNLASFGQSDEALIQLQAMELLIEKKEELAKAGKAELEPKAEVAYHNAILEKLREQKDLKDRISAKENQESASAALEEELEGWRDKIFLIEAGERALYAYNLEKQISQGLISPNQKQEALLIFDQLKATEKLKKVREDSNKKAEQLAKNALSTLKKTKSALKDIGATSLDIFSKDSGMLDGLNDLSNALLAMTKELGVNANAIEENAKAREIYDKNTEHTGKEKEENLKAFAQVEEELQKKSLNTYIQGSLAIGGAVAGMFDKMAAAAEENSKKQEALQRTSLALQMVMAVASGAVAVINGFRDGGWPLAITIAAGVATQLATLGVAMASIGGGEDVSENQKMQGTGSVLGDEEAVSESLGNSTELLEDYASIGNKHSSQMLISLQSIDYGIKSLGIGLSGSVAFDEFTSNPTSNVFEPAEGVSKFINSYEEDIRDVGIVLGDLSYDGDELKVEAQTFADVLDEGFKSAYFARVDTYTKWMVMFKKDSNTENPTQEIEGNLAVWFDDILRNLITATNEGMQALTGKTETQIQDTLANTEIVIGFEGSNKLSLKDMDTEEMNEAIAGVFSKLSDDIILSIAPSMREFQNVGEGLFETFSRLVGETEEATNALLSMGVKAIDYTEIIEKHNPVGAQIVKQTVALTEEYESIRDIMQTLQGDARELTDTWKELKDVQQLLIGVGFGIDALSTSLINGAGGELGDLSSALNDYFENFFTEEEQFEVNLASMQQAFSDLGREMPTSKKAFKDLIDALVKGGKETSVLLGNVLQLSEGVSDLSDDFDDLMEDLEDSSLIWSTASKEAKAAGQSLLEVAVAAHLEAVDALAAFDGSAESLENLQSAIDSRYDAELNLINSIADAILAIDNKIAQTAEDMALVGLNDEEKYDFYAEKAEQLARDLRSGVYQSPEEIQEATLAAIDASTKAFELLDEQAQLENRADFLSFNEGIGLDSKALLLALEDIALASTVDLAESALEIVGIDNIVADISSILEIMRTEEDEPNQLVSDITQGALESTQPLDIESVIHDTYQSLDGLGLELEELTLKAAEDIIASITKTIPGTNEILLEFPNIVDDLALSMQNSYEEQLALGNPNAYEYSVGETAEGIESVIAPYLPTYDIPQSGQETYDYFDSNVTQEISDSAADQVEAANTNLDAAAMMVEAAKIMQDLSLASNSPIYIESTGAVNA